MCIDLDCFGNSQEIRFDTIGEEAADMDIRTEKAMSLAGELSSISVLRARLEAR